MTTHRTVIVIAFVLAFDLAAATLGPPALPPDHAWLSWDAPVGCPEADEVADAIGTRLGRAVEKGDVVVAARVVDEGAAGYRLALSTTIAGVEESRELVAHDCRSLADATALIVALSVDALAVAETIAQPSGDEIVAPAPPEHGDPVAAPRQPRPASARPERTRERTPSSRADGSGARIDGSLFVAGGVEIGALPGVSGGASLGGALRWPRARIELVGSYLAPRRERGDIGDVVVQMGIAGARGCARVGRGRVEAPLCAGMEVGAQRGEGERAPSARTNTGVWLAALVGTGVHVQVLRRLAVFGRLDLAIPFVQPGFDLVGVMQTQSLFTAAPVSGRLWIGLELPIPGA